MRSCKLQRCLDFDDVLIEPIPSDVNSREDVDVSIQLSPNLKLKFPLIASPMRGIVNAKFASALSDLGGLAVLHRFYDTNEEMFSEIESMKGKNFGVSLGLGDDYTKLLDYSPAIIVLDLANAYTKSVFYFCQEIKNYIVNSSLHTLLMTGNVCTFDGAVNLANAGVDIVRYGIGGGGLCSTRNVTGVAIPQISALQSVYNLEDVLLCADGGIRNSGDFVKSIVAGADFGMAGSLFAQTFESSNDGIIYGMASRKLNEMKYTQIKSVEGLEKAVEKKYSLKQFVDEFSWGIRSAGTYLNAKNLDEIRQNGKFVLAGTGSIKSL